ncbi:hypothetical protein ANCCAN_23872 [Ancylostoma caninum]|uniref:Uncharacterized protein n=1 Tax=Ancylostoma caninum TaxID=29170 RepID=A0A368FHJ2_ANCCA|nr:hypothetical protein ANCCAN_23872 [Ancylostoma caninum]
MVNLLGTAGPGVQAGLIMMRFLLLYLLLLYTCVAYANKQICEDCYHPYIPRIKRSVRIEQYSDKLPPVRSGNGPGTVQHVELKKK